MSKNPLAECSQLRIVTDGDDDDNIIILVMTIIMIFVVLHHFSWHGNNRLQEANIWNKERSRFIMICDNLKMRHWWLGFSGSNGHGDKWTNF